MSQIWSYENKIIIGNKIRSQFSIFFYIMLIILFFFLLITLTPVIDYFSNFGIGLQSSTISQFSNFLKQYIQILLGFVFFSVLILSFSDKKVIINYQDTSLKIFYNFMNFSISKKIIPFSSLKSIDLQDTTNKKVLLIESTNTFRKKIILKKFYKRDINIRYNLNILTNGIEKCKTYIPSSLDNKIFVNNYYDKWNNDKTKIFDGFKLGYLIGFLLIGILILEFIYKSSFDQNFNLLDGINFFLSLFVIFLFFILIIIFQNYINDIQIDLFNYYSKKELLKDFFLSDYENPLFYPFQVIIMLIIFHIFSIFLIFYKF